MSSMVKSKRQLSVLLLAVAAMAAVALAIYLRSPGDSGQSAGPEEEEEARPARLLFASDFSDGLSEFPEQIHPERIEVVDDPVLGSERSVLRFEVHNEDTGPTENPRAQLETPFDFEEGDDRYSGFSYLFPEEFPTELPSEAWVALGSIAYGPPFDGAGPLSIRVQNSPNGEGAELRWQRNDTYDNDIAWTGPKIADIQGRWVDFVFRAKLHRDPDEGFVELWMNTGDGWERQELNGERHLEMNTYDDSNDGGANNTRIGLYYRQDIDGPLTMYQGPLKIAAAGKGAFDMVAPRSYP